MKNLAELGYRHDYQDLDSISAKAYAIINDEINKFYKQKSKSKK